MRAFSDSYLRPIEKLCSGENARRLSFFSLSSVAHGNANPGSMTAVLCALSIFPQLERASHLHCWINGSPEFP